MAFADFFNKNQQAAAFLLKGVNPDLFKSILEKANVGVAFDTAAIKTKEGRAALDLSIRLAARLYPNLSLIALDDPASMHCASYEALAKAINPQIDVQGNFKNVTHCLVVGETALSNRQRSGIPVFYIGSDNWIAKLSAKKPIGSSNSKNPFGAGVAACIGAANIFRCVFSEQLPGSRLDSELAFSVLDLNPKAARPVNPPFRKINLGELHLVGAGAVGNGFLWATTRLDCRGQLHVIDAETLALSNLQRYVQTIVDEVNQPKTALAQAWNRNKHLAVHAHASTWEKYVEACGTWSFERVAVAVDNAQARIEIQASLPKKIFNSWTQSGEVGLSRHDFLGEMACMACLYIPRTKRPNFDEIVLAALKLPSHMLMDVRRRLDTQSPTERGFLEAIAVASGVVIDCLLPYEGKPLREFYVQAICGGTVMEFASVGQPVATDVPMAFQSALAGILLAADVVADVAQLRSALPTITQIDLLRAFPAIPSHMRKKQGQHQCLCNDPDFMAAYRAKYPGNSYKKAAKRA